MLYLYTVMMLAWDLDIDTHSHFRRYLDVFINQRKISKDLKEFVQDPYRGEGKILNLLENIQYNNLRCNLPNRMYRNDYGRTDGHADYVHGQGGRLALTRHQISYIPRPIEDIHKSQYYHEGVKKSDILKS